MKVYKPKYKGIAVNFYIRDYSIHVLFYYGSMIFEWIIERKNNVVTYYEIYPIYQVKFKTLKEAIHFIVVQVRFKIDELLELEND